MARRQRRRQIEEALEEEREREALLVERLEEVVLEEEGPRIDERVFARLDPGDAEIVREALGEHSPFFDEEAGDPDAFAAADAEPNALDVEDELARLEAELADSRRRQLAFTRYLEALDS